MKAFLKWLGRVVGTALCLVLVIVMLPYASRWAAKLIPDLTGAAMTTSATLSRKLAQSARLECIQADREGILESNVDALLIGTVQSVQIAYDYHASIGIDLSKVEIRTEGSRITLRLPEMEVISDSLTPTKIDRKDFWYPLTDERREKLLEDERTACRTAELEAAQTEDGWAYVITALESTVSGWMSEESPRLPLQYEHP